VEVNPDRLAEIARINREVNERVDWATDLEIYGVEERWALPQQRGNRLEGDCEDYALEKRRLLIEAGIPPAALAFATTYSPSTGHHAVLIVRTSAGDYVLDNANSWILPWRETTYVWQHIQEGSDLLTWRDIAS
jgi:predicted transglutaminase-like cysteine proteinase